MSGKRSTGMRATVVAPTTKIIRHSIMMKNGYRIAKPDITTDLPVPPYIFLRPSHSAWGAGTGAHAGLQQGNAAGEAVEVQNPGWDVAAEVPGTGLTQAAQVADRKST